MNFFRELAKPIMWRLQYAAQSGLDFLRGERLPAKNTSHAEVFQTLGIVGLIIAEGHDDGWDGISQSHESGADASMVDERCGTGDNQFEWSVVQRKAVWGEVRRDGIFAQKEKSSTAEGRQSGGGEFVEIPRIVDHGGAKGEDDGWWADGKEIPNLFGLGWDNWLGEERVPGLANGNGPVGLRGRKKFGEKCQDQVGGIFSFEDWTGQGGLTKLAAEFLQRASPAGGHPVPDAHDQLMWPGAQVAQRINPRGGREHAWIHGGEEGTGRKNRIGPGQVEGFGDEWSDVEQFAHHEQVSTLANFEEVGISFAAGGEDMFSEEAFGTEVGMAEVRNQINGGFEVRSNGPAGKAELARVIDQRSGERDFTGVSPGFRRTGDGQ